MVCIDLFDNLSFLEYVIEKILRFNIGIFISLNRQILPLYPIDYHRHFGLLDILNELGFYLKKEKDGKFKSKRSPRSDTLV